MRILEIACGLELIIIGLLVLYIAFLTQKIKGLQCKSKSNEQELNDWREKLLDKVKEKIVLTEESEMRIKSGEDIVSRFIYQQEDIKRMGEELFGIFSAQVASLKEQFPQLTELDMLVFCLLGIGMDNVEICILLRMERRTLYRRRQLMAMRIGISSSQLDEFAINLLLKNE